MNLLYRCFLALLDAAPASPGGNGPLAGGTGFVRPEEASGPKLRDGAAARRRNPDPPGHRAGLSTRPRAPFGSAGRVTPVAVFYPRDYVNQRLVCAGLNRVK